MLAPAVSGWSATPLRSGMRAAARVRWLPLRRWAGVAGARAVAGWVPTPLQCRSGTRRTLVAAAVADAAAVHAATVRPRGDDPLRKNVPVTPEALRAFVKLRRELFSIPTSHPSRDADADADGDASVQSTSAMGALHRLVQHQTDALLQSLEAGAGQRRGDGAGGSGGGSDCARPSGGGGGVQDDANGEERGASAAGAGAAAGCGPDPDETLDVMFHHRILLLQARKGYRCNVDSLIIASHVAAQLWTSTAAAASRTKPMFPHPLPPPPMRIADLGAGAGIIGVALALRGGGAGGGREGGGGGGAGAYTSSLPCST